MRAYGLSRRSRTALSCIISLTRGVSRLMDFSIARVAFSVHVCAHGRMSAECCEAGLNLARRGKRIGRLGWRAVRVVVSIWKVTLCGMVE